MWQCCRKRHRCLSGNAATIWAPPLPSFPQLPLWRPGLPFRGLVWNAAIFLSANNVAISLPLYRAHIPRKVDNDFRSSFWVFNHHTEEMTHLRVIVTEMKRDFRSLENIRQLQKPPVKWGAALFRQECLFWTATYSGKIRIGNIWTSINNLM